MGSFEGLKRVPMLRLLIPFILGIIIHHNIGLSASVIVSSSLILFLLICIIWIYELANPGYHRLWYYGLALNLFTLLVSMGLIQGKDQRSSFSGFTERDHLFSAKILGYPEERKNSYRVMIEPDCILTGDSITRISGRTIAWMEKDSSAAILSPGDRIILSGAFRKIVNAGNPFEFNYKRYMNLQGVSGEIYLPKDSWLRTKNENSNRGMNPRHHALRLRYKLLNCLSNSGIAEKEYSVAAAILLGYKSSLDHETRQLYAGAGAMHILAVSGLHVGIVYILFIGILGFLRNTKYHFYLGTLTVVLVIWFYAYLTGLSPSVTRSAIMFTFLAIATKTGRSTTVINTIASAAFLQLLIDPYSLFLVGFQLSYLAVLGIVYYQPLIYPLLRSGNFISDKIWILCTVSFSAQIFIFPLSIYYFNQFPIYFLLTSVMAVPLAMLILYSGFFFFLFSFVPVISDGLVFILNTALKFLNFITGAVSYLPLSQIKDIVISLPMLIILYGIIITITIFLIRKKIRFLQYALLLIITALVFRADHILRTNSQNIFIVYNERSESLYNFISGNNNTIISTDPEIYNTGYMPYVASRTALNLNALNTGILSECEFFNPDLSATFPYGIISGNFVFFAGYRIYFSRPGDAIFQITEVPVYVDFLVISDQSSLTLDFIGNAVIPEIVVIDSSVSFRQKLKIVEYCKDRGFVFHDVNDSGSFIAGM